MLHLYHSITSVSFGVHLNLKNIRVTQCLTYLCQTVTAVDAYLHLIDLLMHLTKQRRPPFYVAVSVLTSFSAYVNLHE